MAALGVVADCLGQPAKEAFLLASELGFCAVQIGAVSGDLAPRNLARSGRRHVVRYLVGLGLRLEALGGPREGLGDERGLDQRVTVVSELLILARDLGARAVTVRVGSLDGAGERGRAEAKTPVGGFFGGAFGEPDVGVVRSERPGRGRGYHVTVGALRHLAERADGLGITLAVETSGVRPATLATMLAEVGCPRVAAGYDPAEVVIGGGDAVGEIAALAGRIAVAYVRDAVAGDGERPGYEVEIGRGIVDWRHYLAMLDQSGFVGVPLLKRMHATRPLTELAARKKYIESLMR